MEMQLVHACAGHPCAWTAHACSGPEARRGSLLAGLCTGKRCFPCWRWQICLALSFLAKSPVPPRSAGERRLVCRWEMLRRAEARGCSGGLLGGREGCSALPCYGKTPCPLFCGVSTLPGSPLQLSPPRAPQCQPEPQDGNQQKDLGGRVI